MLHRPWRRPALSGCVPVVSWSSHNGRQARLFFWVGHGFQAGLGWPGLRLRQGGLGFAASCQTWPVEAKSGGPRFQDRLLRLSFVFDLLETPGKKQFKQNCPVVKSIPFKTNKGNKNIFISVNGSCLFLFGGGEMAWEVKTVVCFQPQAPVFKPLIL